MSLSSIDLNAIRQIVRDEVQAEVIPLSNRLIGIENDIQEVYDIFTNNKIKVV